MAKKPKPEPDDREQSARFIETAKALGAEESGKEFDRVVDRVVSTKPTTQKPTGPAKKSGPS